MRTSRFGFYCHTASEVLSQMTLGVSYCYVDEDFIEGPDVGEWSAEVVENANGNTVCYIGAPTEAAVRAIITELGLEIV